MAGFSAPQGKPKGCPFQGSSRLPSPGRTLRRPEPLRRAFSGTEGSNPSSSSGESRANRLAYRLPVAQLPVTGPSDVIGDSGLEAEPTPDRVPAVKGASIPTTTLRVIVCVFPLTQSGEGCAS